LRCAWRGVGWMTCAGWAMLAVVVWLRWELLWCVLWVLPLAVLGGWVWLRRAGLVLWVFLLLILVPGEGMAAQPRLAL
jgi:hypothetical protein